MENGFGKAFSESYAMKGGDGPHSYAQNSKAQALYQYLFPILCL